MRKLALVAIAATGCMRIYEDGNLPDIEIEWLVPLLVVTSSADEPAPQIAALRFDIDDTTVAQVTPDVGSVRIADLSRDEHAVRGFGLDAASAIVAGSGPVPIDLRDGNSHSARLLQLFTRLGYANVSWQFPDSATCTSLGAAFVVVHFDPGAMFRDGCNDRGQQDPLAAGSYAVHVELTRDDGTAIAVSPTVQATVPPLGEVVDIGPLVLTAPTGTRRAPPSHGR
jgi:hypothetical protein